MIADWARARDYSVETTNLYKEHYKLPNIKDFDMLVVMGGPMSVNDDVLYAWLAEERTLIREAIDSNKFVLGICLGAQQIAKALGANVSVNNHKEIGWHPIAFTDQALGLPILRGLNTAMTVFHWHSEKFDIPAGATLLASSAACVNQGFLYQDRVLALQFHIEMDTVTIEKIVEACSDELVADQYIQGKDTILEKTKRWQLERTLYQLLDNWLGR